MRAVTRRTAVRDQVSCACAMTQQFGIMTLDRAARRVFVAGAEVSLTPREFDLLACWLPAQVPFIPGSS